MVTTWDFWERVLAGVIGGVSAGVILIYVVPQFVVAATLAELQRQGYTPAPLPTASVGQTAPAIPTYSPCVACQREVTPKW